MDDKGTLILGADTPILDIDVRKHDAVVTLSGQSALVKEIAKKTGEKSLTAKTMRATVPFDSISWIAPGFEL